MSTKKTGIQNAEQIIEQFGGIRPMAKKLDVAVTTIQGWKKRGKIPAARRTAIINAAEKYNIDIDQLLSEKPAANTQPIEPETSTPSAATPALEQTSAPTSVETTQDEKETKQVKTEQPKEEKAQQKEPTKKETPSQDNNATHKSLESFDDKLAQLERNAVTKSTWITLALLCLALVAAFFFLFPNAQTGAPLQESRISEIEQNVNQLQSEVKDVKSSQSFLKTVIPTDLDERIAKIQKQAENAVDGVNTALDKAEDLSRTIADATISGDISIRLDTLEDKINDLRGSPELNELMSRMSVMTSSLTGQEQLGQATQDILSALRTAKSTAADVANPEDAANALNTALNEARNTSASLSHTFENIPQDDLKAAALLLSLTQFRNSLNRDNVAFENDLEIIRKLVGEDNPELLNSLETLAPHAESGVLTPKSLSDELKAVSGEIIVDSLQGKDVSIKDKFASRLNKFIKIEKDGELISGTETQSTLTKSEYLLEQGDIEGAIATMETLEPAHADVVTPWIKKAKTTLNARRVEAKLKSTVSKLTRPHGKNAPLYVTP